MTGNDGIVTYAPVNPIGSLREAWSKASIESQFHKPGMTSTCPPPFCKSNRHSARQPTGKSSLVKCTCGVHNTWARSTPGALRERKIKGKSATVLNWRARFSAQYVTFKLGQSKPTSNSLKSFHQPTPSSPFPIHHHHHLKIVHILQRFFHRRAQIFYSVIVVSTLRQITRTVAGCSELLLPIGPAATQPHSEKRAWDFLQLWKKNGQLSNQHRGYGVQRKNEKEREENWGRAFVKG